MRQKIVAGNWKMNTTADEGQKLTSEIVNMVQDEISADVQVILAPPFTHLQSVGKLIGSSKKIALAAQNVNENESGAYTGEVSAGMLQSVGVEWVIIGHSERREYFKESGEQLAKKINAALKGGLRPIFCCGEPLEVREKEEHEGHVKQQLQDSLFHLSKEQISKVVIAYEPVWAIGTGKTASAGQAQEMHKSIRRQIAEKWGEEVAGQLRILYGGSMKPDNAKELMDQPDVDGGLIGGASLKSRDFLQIIKSA
ncbi:triose-phosphate isomerase [Nafulsella turpanensis]|uniref:triose-phosphate isomerase n=1 Tax=Nafulsella turpanensis TaxID=1265690 RepID=UPI00034B1D71|nr:triose-phosphate isomerase [Nafulsella turpanensis]